MLDIYLFSVIAFFGVLGIIIFLDRKNIEFKYVLLMRRTKKGIELLDKIAKFKRFWKIVGIIGIMVCLFLMFNGYVGLIEVSKLIIAGKIKVSPGGVILPSPTPQTEIGVGYILIPFWFWIIIIPTILFPHEIAHGIISRAEKIRVKSAGLLLFLIFPGAFVEPDEKRLKKAKLLTKLKVFSAGSFANVIFAFLLFNPILGIGIVPNIVWPLLVPDQVQLEVLLVNVTEGGPAAQSGLENGTIIKEINKMPMEINYLDFTSGNYLRKYLQDMKVGNVVEIVANNTRYEITVGETVINETNRTKPYIGIVTTLKTNGNITLFNFVIELFFWMWLLNYAVAVFNILPIYPLDGGLMLEAITKKITKKHYKKIVGVVTIFTIGLVLFTIFGPSIIETLQFFLSQTSL